MTKNRVAIPKNVREQVENEFSHRCAICGADKPQIHHIDENPENNDLLNLIPLCPNCHLTDHHNPTKNIDPKRLRLFREYKDPTILKPQFQPLLKRLQFFDEILEETDTEELSARVSELSGFVEALEMGSFYAKKIMELAKKPSYGYAIVIGNPDSERNYDLRFKEDEKAYRSQLKMVKKQVTDLAIELLRFQKW